MARIPLVLFFIIGLLVLTFGILIIYTCIYNICINKMLQNGSASKIQWPTPKNVVITILLVFLIAFCVVFIIDNFSGSNNRVVYSESYTDDTIVGTVDELKGTYAEIYLDAYTSGALTGYKKIEKSEGNFHYICFQSEEEYDTLHPQFIMFIEYVGGEVYSTYAYESTLYINNGNNFSGGSYDAADQLYCVIGNVDLAKYESYSLTFALYKDEAMVKEDFEQDAGLLPRASEQITIKWPMMHEE